MKKDDRLDLLTAWISQFDGCAGAKLELASIDASFRRYFRVAAGTSYIAMDAPPPQEDCRPFVAIAGYLAEMGLNSPRVLQADVERGFLLLTDLGPNQYLDIIGSSPDRAEALYQDALDALLLMQEEGRRFQAKLPPYAGEMLHFELSLFRDWLYGTHLGLEFSAEDESRWQATCDALVAAAIGQARTFVHRDYHSRNLMVTVENNPGILDFQDAVEGPYTYDLASLLKDCYVKWPPDIIARRANYFYANLQRPPGTQEDFMRDFDLTGVIRHLKAAGIFARLLHRDGKPGYLKDVPRTLSYVVDIAPDYDELAFLHELVAARVLPALEAAG